MMAEAQAKTLELNPENASGPNENRTLAWASYYRGISNWTVYLGWVILYLCRECRVIMVIIVLGSGIRGPGPFLRGDGFFSIYIPKL